jgi:hypothetical protein
VALKGAAPEHDGDPQPDRWTITPDLTELAGRWGI